MEPVKFVNPLTKQDVFVFADMVFGVTFMVTQACTVLTGPGGAAIPVDCTVEEAIKKILDSRANSKVLANKGVTDGV